MPETQMAMSPPRNGGKAAIASDFPDYIQEIGDRIANLTIREASKLSDYLATNGINWKL